MVNSGTSVNIETENKKIKKPRRRSRRKKQSTDDDNVVQDISQNNVTIDMNESSSSLTSEASKKDNQTKDKKSRRQKDDRPTGKAQEEKNKNYPPTRKELKEKNKKDNKTFTSYLPVHVIEKILLIQPSNAPSTIKGYIRINPRCIKKAYVSQTNCDQDILIEGLINRNRALEGDLVAVVVDGKEKRYETDEGVLQKTGSVICIFEKIHPRKAIGFLKKQDNFVYLQPRDSRVPNIKIDPRTVPVNFYDNPDKFEDTLFFGSIVDWKNVAFAEG